MTNVVVVGAQWGDEGKGKIVDWLSNRADIVVRFQGGHNAGHTLVIDGVVFKLSLLPSGIVRPGKISVIGSGVVIDPWALLNEITTIRQSGVNITPDSLKIAENANLILPIHSHIDQLREKNLGKGKIGTTGRGIGPTYEDKAARRGVRICDLRAPDFLRARIENMIDHHNIFLKGMGENLINAGEIYDKVMAIADDITPYATPVWKLLDDAKQQGQKILFEGAQGILLDVDHGTYPFVTSSNTHAGQAAAGAGIGANSTGYVLGIVKAYTTRVGSGPFPTELDDDIGEKLGKKGHEFGVVTGRKRRCGWFDAALVRQTCKISGIDGIALTKMDVLDGFDEIKVNTGYDIDGKKYDYLPADPLLQERAKPIYETHKGWQAATCGARRWADLNADAIKYVKRIEELIETPVALLSTSPERDDTILVTDPFK